MAFIYLRSSAKPPLTCDGCGAKVPAQTIVCKHCGYKIRAEKEKAAPADGGRKVQSVDGELQEIPRDRLKKAYELEELQATSVHDLRRLAEKRGWADPVGWAAMMWTHRERVKRSAAMGGQQAIAFYRDIMDEPDA